MRLDNETIRLPPQFHMATGAHSGKRVMTLAPRVFSLLFEGFYSRDGYLVPGRERSGMQMGKNNNGQQKKEISLPFLGRVCFPF